MTQALSHGRFFLLFLFLAIVLASAGPVPGQTAGEGPERAALESSISQMEAWLATDPKGKQWNDLLQTEQLKQQIASGREADREKVREILKLYQSDRSGLKAERFLMVRNDLARWLASQDRPTLEELPERVRAARDQFQPVTAEDLRDTKNELIRAFNQLNRLLAESSEKAQSSWKNYLKLDELRGQLAAGASPDYALLENIYQQLRSGKTSLELPDFMELRSSLRRYIDKNAFAADEQAQEHFEQQIDALAAAIESYRAEPNRETALQIGRTLGWLERADQVPQLVADCRARFSQPNLLVRGSKRFLAAGVERPVDQVNDVTDYILETSIQGKARTVGEISLELVPDLDRAAFVIHLKGTAVSENQGYNGPVVVYSTSTTNVRSSKPIFFDTKGAVTLPATARCSTDTKLKNIQANRPAAENIAWDRAMQNLPQAEQIAARHAEDRFENQMNDQVNKLLAKANRSYSDKFRKPLLRYEAFPVRVDFTTLRDGLYLEALQRDEFQLSAPTEAPALTGEHDIAVRMHETLVTNTAETLLGGQNVTDEQLAERIGELLGEVPEELKISPDKDPWSIQFVRSQPVSLRVDDDQVYVSLTGNRFTRGDQEITDTIRIEADYRVEPTDIGARWRRQGEVRVIFVGREDERLGMREITFRTFLRQKFEAMFKEEIGGEGLKLPGAWEKIGTLRLAQLSADDGWLTLAWRMPEPGEPDHVAEQTGTAAPDGDATNR